MAITRKPKSLLLLHEGKKKSVSSKKPTKTEHPVTKSTERSKSN
jgi:hypothetical protein